MFLLIWWKFPLFEFWLILWLNHFKILPFHYKTKLNDIKETWRLENANVNWGNTYRLPFLCTTETKLRVFQFMFLHRRIATNDFLFKIGLKQADSCSFCGEFTETLAHLFWYCSYTQKFWKDIHQWITQNTSLNKSIAFFPLEVL